jgi:predicted O-methyltransferase YrrM
MTDTAPTSSTGNSLRRPEVSAVLSRLHRAARGDMWRLVALAPVLAATELLGREIDPRLQSRLFKRVYIPVSRDTGHFLYLVARSLGARRIVEFGSSFGISTIYLAAAARDNGGGGVIGSELEPSKQRAASANLARAGLATVAEVRLGDARETLRDVPEPVDLVLLDGWKDLYLPMLELLTPKLRPGAVVLADNIYRFKRTLGPYVEYVQSGRHGFQSATLSVSDGLEYSYYEGSAQD